MEKIILVLTNVFHWIWTTSIMAFILVGVILIVKLLMKSHFKAKWQYLLWFVLLLRLVLPWSPETSFSLFNLFSKVSQPESPVVSETQIQLTFGDAGTPIDNSSDLMFWIYIGALGVWLIGVLLFATHLFRMNRKFSKKLKQTTPITNNTILLLFEQCKNTLKVKGNITLLAIPEVDSPTLYGFIRPKLLLPVVGLEEFEQNELRYIFLHELAHYKRKDIFVNWVMTILLILHWFNPLLWYGYHRMRDDQELSCDEMAISHIESNELKNYGFTIIKLLQINTVNSLLPTVASFSANKSQIKKRLIMIKSFRKNSIIWSILGLISILLVAFFSLTNAEAADIKPMIEKKVSQFVDMDKPDKPCRFVDQPLKIFK